MQLPNATFAVVDARKVQDYLLSDEHPVGRAKARFFRRLGFTKSQSSLLERALRDHALTGEAEEEARTPYGRKFIVRGILNGPFGVGHPVITIWMLEPGHLGPRLVTAYPGEPT